MKITYFRIKGYINILNGMGLDELVIPFLEFKNRIVLVSGENGTGKSTIIKALTPNPDSSDCFRTDVFIDASGNRQIIEYPAEKEIHYLDYDESGNQVVYKILIQSLVDESKTRRTTKAFISKNNEEMNPNGNVTSFKEIRDDLLGIDPIYLDLSFISSESRGIVDMIPSERRKYMASYIGSLDTYNNIFKIISKKVSNIKSYMNTLNNKIYELGNENELRLKQMQLETELSNLNEERDRLISSLSEVETIVKILDPENKMQDLYTSISEQLKIVKLEMEKNQSVIDNLYSTLGLSPQIQDIDSVLSECKTKYEEYVKNYNDNKSEINNLLYANEVIHNSLEENRARLLSLSTQSVEINIEEAVKQIKDEVDIYSKYLSKSDISILESVSSNELSDLRNDLEKFVENVYILEEQTDSEIFHEAIFRYNDSGLRETYSSNEEEIKRLETLIRDNEDALRKGKENLDILEEFGSTRPKECKIDTCPYIIKYINIGKSSLSKEELIALEAKINSDKEYLETLKNNNARLSIMITIIDKLKVLLSISEKSIFTKIPKLRFMSDKDEILKRIDIHNRFPEFSVIDDLTEKKSVYDNFSKLKIQLIEMESELKIYRNNKSIIDSLSESIKTLESEYSDKSEKIKSINKDCVFLEGLIKDIKSKIQNLEKLIECMNKMKELIEKKKKLDEEFSSIEDKISLVKEKVESVNTIKSSISVCEGKIKPISDTITNIKYSLTNIVNYQQEYKSLSELYDKLVFIRNACSPGNGMGIQSEYIKRYMSDIIVDCNRMLSYMFGGAIQLYVPIINEKQFSIPFIGPGGLEVPDISNGSTAQKCMIGLVFSCVAMMKSSIKYNIPRFDEIDGGLDQSNRITFITVLNQVLDIMNSSQCIICSHNVEFDTQNTSKIICSTKGVRFE